MSGHVHNVINIPMFNTSYQVSIKLNVDGVDMKHMFQAKWLERII